MPDQSSGASAPTLKTLPFAVETHCRRYDGQVAIVTGAAQGLGRVIARRLGEEGATVMMTDVQERVHDAANTLARETNSEFRASVGDLSVAGVADAMIDQTVKEFGKVDVLVNNAAALIRMRLVDFTEELMQQAVAWNVWNTLRCCKAVVPHMQSRKYGRIVNIGGEAWRTGAPFHTLLAGIGKGSMVGLTATLAGEVVKDGITVNCVSPAGIESEADGDNSGAPRGFRDPSWTPPQVLEEMRRISGVANAIGRLAHPTEVASAVAFLGSREAAYVTGQHLGASGGVAML